MNRYLDLLRLVLRSRAIPRFWIRYAIALLTTVSLLAALGTFATTFAFFHWSVALVVGCSVGLLSLVESAAALTICFVIQEVAGVNEA